MKSIIYPLICAISVMVSAFAEAQGTVLDEAKKHIEARQYLLAISLINAELENNPNNINNLQLLARTWELEGDVPEARSAYERLVQQSAAEPDHYFEFADFLRRNLQLEEAKIWFLKYAEFNPTVGKYFAKTCDDAAVELAKSRGKAGEDQAQLSAESEISAEMEKTGVVTYQPVILQQEKAGQLTQKSAELAPVSAQSLAIEENSTLMDATKEPPVATHQSDQQATKTYYIQIAALSQYNPQVAERMKKYSRYGDVYRFETSEGTHKIRIGSFKKLNDALEVLNKMKKAGIKEAFVVTDIPDEKRTHLIVKNTGEMQGQMDANVQEEGKYKIRVGEFKAPEWVDPSPLKDIGTIEHWTRSGWTILILGSFKTVYDANLALDKVKSRGYKEAYLVVEEDGKLYKY
ncbi:MAG: SPOR domain-containing protein [Saprospiraceae bacterium]|nr:SPOR domain-containing protein [Saprospiraceae bacterium]